MTTKIPFTTKHHRTMEFLISNTNGTIVETRGYGPYYTPESLYQKGMYACPECNCINCIDSIRCSECGESRFILRKA